MGEIRICQPAKLIAGFIFSKEDCFQKAKHCLMKKYGALDFESALLPFSHTNYYEEEIGKNAKRKFVSFKKLINRQDLPRIKISTNKIEQKLREKSKRTVNIDPGYLELSKLVLATTKNYNHRIYLNRGIFAEVTLRFMDNTFTPWEWTYPDYRSGDYIQIFNQIRNSYLRQAKTE